MFAAIVPKMSYLGTGPRRASSNAIMRSSSIYEQNTLVVSPRVQEMRLELESDKVCGRHTRRVDDWPKRRASINAALV
jgi:hypothetical protein